MAPGCRVPLQGAIVVCYGAMVGQLWGTLLGAIAGCYGWGEVMGKQLCGGTRLPLNHCWCHCWVPLQALLCAMACYGYGEGGR